jgi:ankyrin repeat protein
LHAAASKGDLEIAKLRLERGADPNAEVESSGNCMHIARGDTSMLTLLAAFGGEYADYEDLSKLSPAALESVYGDELPLRYYVDTADLDILAARMGEDPGIAGEVLELALRSYNGAAKSVVRLCLDWDRSTAKRIQANGLIYTLHRLSVKDEKEMTEIIGWLLAAGMNPNDSDWLRVTSLHRLAIGTQPHGSDGSIYRPHPEVMRLFLEAGADLEAKDEEFHSTPLGWAARWGRTEMVEVLLSAGAATNLNDDLAWATPLAWARKKGHEHIARMLMAEGATA